MENLITIAEADGTLAGYLQSLLESHGITVFVENANTSIMMPHLPLLIPAGIKVPGDQADLARSILHLE